MLVDARARFAKRTAEWIIAARLPKEEVVTRLKLFPPDFNQMITEEAIRIRQQKR